MHFGLAVGYTEVVMEPRFVNSAADFAALLVDCARLAGTDVVASHGPDLGFSDSATHLWAGTDLVCSVIDLNGQVVWHPDFTPVS